MRQALQQVQSYLNRLVQALNDSGSSVAWQDVVEKPTTLAALGVVDAARADTLAAHVAATRSVHGVDNTAELETARTAGSRIAAAVLAHEAEPNPHPQYASGSTTADLAAHEADTTAVHGIADTTLLETQSGAQGRVDAALATHVAAADPHTQYLLPSEASAVYATISGLATHEADTTAIHGIADTSLLETQTGAQTKANAAVATHAALLVPHPALGGHAYQTVAQSIPTGTASGTAVSFNATAFDTSALWAAGSPDRLTIPAGRTGLWLVEGQIGYASNATGQRRARITKNGSTLLGVQSVLAVTVAASATLVSATAVVKLTAGDYVQLEAIQDSGGALNTNVSQPANTRLSATFLGSA